MTSQVWIIMTLSIFIGATLGAFAVSLCAINSRPRKSTYRECNYE